MQSSPPLSKQAAKPKKKSKGGIDSWLKSVREAASAPAAAEEAKATVTPEPTQDVGEEAAETVAAVDHRRRGVANEVEVEEPVKPKSPRGKTEDEAEEERDDEQETGQETEAVEEDEEEEEEEEDEAERDEEFGEADAAGGWKDQRANLLAYATFGDSVPEEIETLVAREHEMEAAEGGRSGGRSERSGTDAPADRSLFGTRMSRSNTDSRGGRAGGRNQDRDLVRAPRVALPPKSANAYQPKRSDEALSRDEQLRRLIKGLLNKICPEKVQTIANKIKDEAEVATIQELEIVIGLIIEKALTEKQYSDSYADLVYHLKDQLPEFPSPDGRKKITVKSALLNVVQTEFESMPRTLAPEPGEAEQFDPAELEMRTMKRKQRLLNTMRFIGNLFLRKLLQGTIITMIIQDLIGTSRDVDAVPEEYVIECICELLNSIGHTLESMPVGQECLQQVCGRMRDLRTRKGADGKAVYRGWIHNKIQDVLETRQAGWVKRSFNPMAKTKEEVRIEQERDLKAQEAGKDKAVAETVQVGVRPAYLTREAGGGPDTQGAEAWQEATRGRRNSGR